MLGALPLPAALAVGRGLGTLYGSVVRYHREDAAAALARCLPDKTPAERRLILTRMYRNLGMNVVEELRLSRSGAAYLDRVVSWDGDGYAHEVLAARKGMLVLSGHIGNFELLCTMAPHFNYPTTVIVKKLKHSAINAYWQETRAQFGLKFAAAHNSLWRCLSALRKNEVVAVVLDQNMTRSEGIFVDFFGKPACTSPGLAYMSALSGAAVLPTFIIRLANGRHRVKALPPIPPPPDREPATIHEYTQRYTRVIEDIVRQYPDQWIWIHRRWKTVPLEPRPQKQEAGCEWSGDLLPTG